MGPPATRPHRSQHESLSGDVPRRQLHTLRRFDAGDAGGKLLMTYGWADSILQPMMGVDYYEEAMAVNGAGTDEFFRLFMVPGMAHCSGDVGPDRHDAVTAVIDWVEAGRARTR